MDQLQFTQEETSRFYVNIVGVKLTNQQLDRLRIQTEGWAAGLQLMALSLRSKSDYDLYIREFNGNHRSVSDYLYHEVMADLPEELYHFLLETSVLTKMNAMIADDMTQRLDSQRMLETIQWFNLFLVPLDDQNVWFRYHHLFAHFLQGLLKKNGFDKWLNTHRIASKSYAKYGFMDDAIQHALAAQDYELAQKYMLQHIPTMLRRGENEILPHWFKSFPAETALIPELGLLYAFALVLTGDVSEADLLLDEVAAICSSVDNPNRKGQLQSGILFVRANLMFMNGDFQKWLSFVDGILDEILPENAVFYNYNYNQSEPLVRRTPLGLKGVISRETETIGRLFTGILDAYGWKHSLINLYVKQSLSEGYYEWNQLERSRELLQEVEQAAKSSDIPGLAIPLAITRARLNCSTVDLIWPTLRSSKRCRPQLRVIGFACFELF